MTNFIKKLFHSHTIIPFKWVEGRLVAGYCKKCGCVQTGNPEYYDGSFYQNTKCGEEAIKFIDDNIAYVKSRYDGREKFRKMLDSGIEFKGRWDVMNEWDEAVVNKYETVEEYERIKNIIIKCGDF